MQSKSFSSAKFNVYAMFLHRRVLPNIYCIALSYSCAYFSLCISGRAFCLNTQRKCSTHIENPTRCNSVSNFISHLYERWTCSCWTLSASSNYTSNNLLRMQNQRLLVQF
jgi:hypothetical protein